MGFHESMIMSDIYELVIVLVLLVAVLVFCERQALHMDPAEPELIHSTIPFVGHLLEMLWYRDEFYSRINKRSLPIYTFSILKSKIYVVNSPYLAQAALRSKALDFEPFLTDLIPRAFDLTLDARNRIAQMTEEGELTYIKATHEAVGASLPPGPALSSMSAKLLSEVVVSLNSVPEVFEPDSLYLWLRKIFTLAVTSAMFGEHNPFLIDQQLVDALGDFDAAIVPLVMGVFPSVTAPDGFKGRTAIQAALIKYFESGHDSDPDVSALIKTRAAMHKRFGFRLDDSAKAELSMPWAATTNSIPTLYWMLVFIFSNPKFAEQIRYEVSSTILRSDEGGIRHLSIEISKLHSDCPRLVSIYKEAMRLMNQQVSIRFVQADTVICAGDESYILKKGAAVQFPAGLMHKSSAIWGNDALSFDGNRFLKATSRAIEYGKESKRQGKAKRNAYMPFGGGRNLCPGRHFAFAGVLGTAVAIILNFDFISRDGQPIAASYERSRSFGEGTAKPIKEMDVKLVRRKEMQHTTLGFITK